MGRNTKRKRMTFKEFDDHLDKLDLEPILKSRLRQVRWLHNNSNKCSMVYGEKMVRLIIHRLQARIKELEGFCDNEEGNILLKGDRNE